MKTDLQYQRDIATKVVAGMEVAAQFARESPPAFLALINTAAKTMDTDACANAAVGYLLLVLLVEEGWRITMTPPPHAGVDIVEQRNRLLEACRVALRLLKENGHTHDEARLERDCIDAYDTGLSAPLSDVLSSAIALVEWGGQ